jgi:hypothetical protein
MYKIAFRLRHHIHTFWVTEPESQETTRVFLDAGTIDITKSLSERDISRIRGRVLGSKQYAKEKNC